MKNRTICAIAAVSINGIIGDKGNIPWRSKLDFAHFKDMTMNKSVVMGRKTWDSLPTKSKPLVGRRNIILSKTKGLVAPGAEVASSVSQVLEMTERDLLPVYVIGGVEIYKAFEKHITAAVITHVGMYTQGDAVLPEFYADWPCLLDIDRSFVEDDTIYDIVRYWRPSQ